MDFNKIQVKGNISGKIEQKISFRSLAVGLIAAALIVVIGFGGCGGIGDILSRCLWGETYWVTESTGRIHRAGCRYYGVGKGAETRQPVGSDCRVCGGRGK